MADKLKLFFELTPDEEGYPPVSVESVWALPRPAEGGYELDNIPFFACEAAAGDIVTAREREGVLWFESVLAPSGNSLIRIVAFDPAHVPGIRETLSDLGCDSEYDGAHHLIAVNIPATASLAVVRAWLAEKSAAGSLDYEEAILRQ